MDVEEVIDREPLSRFQAVTMGCAGSLCGFVVVLDGFDTQAIGLVAPAIAETFGVPLASFGVAFSAGLLGLMVGAMTLGPIADRLGRRCTVIVATLVFGAFTALSPSATSMGELALLRFLTGLGLGGAIPNLVALATEYAPKRLQAMIVAWMFAGIPIGAICEGYRASYTTLALAGGAPPETSRRHRTFSSSSHCRRLAMNGGLSTCAYW